MAAGKTVYAFQTGTAKKAFALTYEKKGTNLPRDREWRAWKSFDENDPKRPIGFDQDAHNALAKHGFWVPSNLADEEVTVVAPAKAKPRVARKR
jgi:hypothetical protein